MLRTTLVLLSCFISLSLFGQTQQISFRLKSTDLPCEDIPKQLILSTQLFGADSILVKEQFLSCQQTIQFPKLPGKYSLEIRTQLFESVVIDFKLDEKSADSVSLGEFRLKEPVAQLDEVTITGVQRKFIEIDADKTTLTVKDNPVLSISSIYDAILKIPGVMPYPGGGFAIGGQMASVYFENVPTSLSTDDLMNLLKSLPANSVETIEIISNPGASYDANLTGAIININSIGRASKWFSGTVTLNYGLNQNQKMSPSIVLNGRQSKWSWQFQTGVSINERSSRDTSARIFDSFSPVINFFSDRKEQTQNNYIYYKPSVILNLSKRSNLTLNYNGSYSNNRIQGISTSEINALQTPFSYENDYRSRNFGISNEGIIKFRQEFDTLKRVLSVTAFYSNYQNTSKRKNIQSLLGQNEYSILDYFMNINRFYTRADAEVPFEKIKFYVNTGFKYSLMQVDNTGSYNLNNPSEAIFTQPTYQSVIDFDYVEDNIAGYVDLKKKLGKKVSIGAGLRAESFRVKRSSNVTTPLVNNYFNFFPSFNAIYKVIPMVNIIGTYSRKIGIPSFTQYDPNNAGYYDAFSSTSGNTQLKPNFYDNAQFKITFLDYAQVSVNYTHSQFLNLSQIRVEPNSLQMVQSFETYNHVSSLNYFLAVPVPMVLFTKGFKFLDEPIEVDKMSFVYLYGSFTKTNITGYDYVNPNKGMWTMGAYSQFMLPWKIRLNVEYYLTGKGTYQIYEFARNRSAFDVTVSREFYEKKLKASISFDDIFNTEQSNTRVSFPLIHMNNYSKQDTRIIWFKLSYSFGKVEKNESNGLNLPSNLGPGE